MPQYEVLLTGFKVADIENKPEAPWIRRGQFGVIFTNDVQEYANLNLRTEENEAVRSKMPTERSRSRVQTRSRLMAQLKLSSAVLDKLERLAHRVKE